MFIILFRNPFCPYPFSPYSISTLFDGSFLNINYTESERNYFRAFAITKLGRNLEQTCPLECTSRVNILQPQTSHRLCVYLNSYSKNIILESAFSIRFRNRSILPFCAFNFRRMKTKINLGM